MNNDNASLENKLLAKKEFLQLSKLLNRFNIFEATDMGRREIKHTKFLCYLLDPNESHGLGDIFIRNFITLVSEKIENFPRVLDLDFSFAEIKSEFKVAEKVKDSIDCFMEIPLRGKENATIFLAIENKIDSKQGSNQLPKYSQSLGIKYPKDLYKIYLTFHYEEPNTEGWGHVTYANVVLPSVTTTLQLIDDTGSINLKAALKDYSELLIEDEEGDKEKEQLANYLLQDAGIKQYFKDAKNKDKKLHFGEMYVKHKKLVDYICQLDGDIRTQSLRFWHQLKDKVFEVKDENYDQVLIFNHETSVRSYLRFSVLTENNRQRLLAINRESREWLESRCPIAFEVVTKLIYKKSKNADDQIVSELTGEARCEATLVLGPLNESYDRTKLLNYLYKELNAQQPNPKDENFKGVWNRLISTKAKDYSYGKSKVTKQPQEWIEQHVLKHSDDSVELEKWIKDLSVKLNKALDQYFEPTI